MSHTPAPWHVDPTIDTDDGAHIRNISSLVGLAPVDRHVAQVTSHDYGPKLEHQADADAALIAAAPELLEALEQLLISTKQFLESPDGMTAPVYDQAQKDALTAIHKARGLP